MRIVQGCSWQSKFLVDVGCELFSKLLVDARYFHLEILLVHPAILKQLLNDFNIFFIFKGLWLRQRSNLDLLAAFMVLFWCVLSMLLL